MQPTPHTSQGMRDPVPTATSQRPERRASWTAHLSNGVSLGDGDALYFAAGPEGEAAGLFGSLRYTPA